MRKMRFATSLVALALVTAGCDGATSGPVQTQPPPVPAPSPTPSPTPPPSGEAASQVALTGSVTRAHDPAILKDDGTYYVFTTGNLRDDEGLVAVRTSRNLTDWALSGAVFASLPQWAQSAVPGTSGFWAPDIYRHNGEYRLYYSLSRFGENQSAIGLTTTRALNPSAPGSGWTDQGPVVQSQLGDDYNAIDPAPFVDAEGRHWLAFGSFWSGIKMVELDPETGLRLASNDTLYSLASRPSPGAVEAPYIIRHGDYYYLFASFDSCCRGAASTYNTVVGRSQSPTGPYVDASGQRMLNGGGTPVLASGQGEGSRFVGRGHVSILQDDDGQDYIVYHAYDTAQNGTPTLRIRRLTWSESGWPVAQ